MTLKLSNIGERKAIEIIAKIVHGEKFIGDDCAFIDFGKNYLLITTDILTQKTHFPKEMNYYEIGWHSVAINLSDIACKGGVPIGLLIALGLPKNFKVKNLKELSKGIYKCAKKFNTKILGGDTKENENLTICGTAIGLVKKENAMKRKNAKVGDLVCITNFLGYGFLGYFILKKFYNIKNKIFKKIINKFFMPTPAIKEGIALSKFANCCMDISDGLANSLWQLSLINNVGFEIYFEKIPIAKEVEILANKLNLNLEKIIYYGGDYELLLTIKKEKIKKAIKDVEKVGGKLSIIGRVIKDRKNLLIKDEKIKKLENRGWEHFINKGQKE